MVHLSYVVQYDIGPYGSWSICLVVHLSHGPIDFGPFVAWSICPDTGIANTSVINGDIFYSSRGISLGKSKLRHTGPIPLETFTPTWLWRWSSIIQRLTGVMLRFLTSQTNSLIRSSVGWVF